ncbi:MAG: sigma-70 family RNA polymerase sigma factor, partial [Myxococcota bacterium]|nr:sigma-70 family RNA polymerase sigma factor [Myxococcota bacterium]
DALTRAWQNREAYDADRPFYPWLCTIVRNTCRDALRRRKPRANLDPHDVPSPYRGPAEMLAAEDSRQRLHQAMAGLEEDHQEVLRLRHFEDLSYAEMAEALDIAQGTVMSRLYRARRALSRALMEEP